MEFFGNLFACSSSKGKYDRFIVDRKKEKYENTVNLLIQLYEGRRETLKSVF